MSKLQRLRALAFHRQNGRCCYCDFPVWLDAPPAPAQGALAAYLASRAMRCTAEHLVARSDGGRDTAANIAAACWLCNYRRHARPKPLAPDEYRSLVQRRVRRGQWHPVVYNRPCRANIASKKAPATARDAYPTDPVAKSLSANSAPPNR